MYKIATFAVAAIITLIILSSQPVLVQAVRDANCPTPITIGGSYPWGVGVNSHSKKIYVTSLVGPEVSVIDGSTNCLTSTISLPSGGAEGIAVNQKTNMIYVAYGGHFVAVIDGHKDTVANNIRVGTGPIGIAVNPKTNMIYVANYDYGTVPGTVSVIDGGTSTVVNTIPVGSNPYAIAVNPETNRIYVANQGASDQTVGLVSVIDGNTNTVVNTIPVGKSPEAVAANPKTNMIYVVSGSGSLSVINGTMDSVIKTISIDGSIGIGVNPETNMIYVSNIDFNTVSVINGSTNTVANIIPVQVSPTGVGVNIKTDKIYVANSGSNSMSVISG